MKRNVKGLASATKKLADGRKVKYWYAWRGGPRINGKYGSPEFWAHYNELIAKEFRGKGEKLSSLIARFRASQDFAVLSPKTQTTYRYALDIIGAKFGDAPIKAFDDIRMRGELFAWRDEMASTPAKADNMWAVMRRILSFGRNLGKLSINVCERGGHLATSDRSEIIWTDDHLNMLEKVAPPEVYDVAFVALWTGQRQGDVLLLPWTVYDGKRVKLRQSKAKKKGKLGRVVVVPCAKPLKEKLAELRAANEARDIPSTTILTNSRGEPWTEDGFHTAWQKARVALDEANGGPTGLHFHDLRGTAVTRLSLAGCTIPEIASITGHSLQSVQDILDRYLCRDERLAENAIRKLEANERRSKTANRLQTGDERASKNKSK